MCVGSCSGFLAYSGLRDLSVARSELIRVCIFAQVCENRSRTRCVTEYDKRDENSRAVNTRLTYYHLLS